MFFFFFKILFSFLERQKRDKDAIIFHISKKVSAFPSSFLSFIIGDVEQEE